ncbi:carbamoyltransferase family protein [Phytohabitans kaempferiae]|uniref:Carbamoyltransferase n=1 Tax=Phytohabitans kaempferiae TaxID=1620943 RepID=A0ABV6LYU1_9ACTN
MSTAPPALEKESELIVLGYSGLGASAAYKRKVLPGADPRTARMRQGLDSAAALLDEHGRIVASAQERHDGDKGTGAFPAGAIDACLREVGAEPGDIDVVAHGFDYEPSRAWEENANLAGWYKNVYARDVQRAMLTAAYPKLRDTPLVHVRHHLAHAASAYYLSGFDEALVLVADGMGEKEAITVFHGAGGQLTERASLPIGSSLGILYGALTHHLGFLFSMDEYKVMGLAPYGDPAAYADAFRGLVRLGPGGTVHIPVIYADRTHTDRETHGAMLRVIAELLGPARQPDAPIEQRHLDIAAALQRRLEEALLHVLTEHIGQTGLRRLCMAGGVALNCTANGTITRSGLVDDLFVQPAAGDDGTALGAALVAARRQRPAPPVRMAMPYWGEGCDPAKVAEAVGQLPAGYTVLRLGEAALVEAVADRVTAGQVVAWCQGRMEFGPRALGNRSILADPRSPTMRQHLNGIVKQREEFRPFAPAVVAEEATTYFDIPDRWLPAFRHMLVTAPVRERYRAQLPAVTHVDGSARVQVVLREEAPLFAALLTAVGARTGMSVVLNTSFNLRGQPIVRTPEDAVATFARSEMDALALGEFLVLAPGRAEG